jgi:hypothetical protein
MDHQARRRRERRYFFGILFVTFTFYTLGLITIPTVAAFCLRMQAGYSHCGVVASHSVLQRNASAALHDLIDFIALSQFCSKGRIYISRENLANYSGPRVKAVITEFTSTISPLISPLFISLTLDAIPKASIGLLRSLQPVAAGDTATVVLLRRHRINALPSGHIWMTLGNIVK